MKRAIYAAAIAAVLVAGVASCGSSDDNSGEVEQLQRRIAELETENAQLREGGPVDAASSDENPPSTTEPATTTTTERATTTTALTTTTSTTTTTTTIPVPVVGSRESPVPLGSPIPAGDWTYLVIGFEIEGVWNVVEEANQFNEPAPPGSQYVRLAVQATFTGDGAETWAGRRINLVGTSGRTYSPADACCEGPPLDALRHQAETFNGGVSQGWVYFIVDEADVPGPWLAFDPDVDYTDVPGGVGFFAAT
jgi:outer membrane murein-binding lipoprotein Lpp